MYKCKSGYTAKNPNNKPIRNTNRLIGLLGI